MEPGDARMAWKNLGEQTAYETKWFRVLLADVELPDGRHLDHYVVRLPPVALCVPVSERDEVLLLWRHRFITGTWGWEPAAGIVEPGETVEQAAARECLEETGWRPGPLRHLITVEPANGLTDAVHVVFQADGAEYAGPPEDDFESSRREWVPLAQVPRMCAEGEIRSANAVAALLLLYQRRVGGAAWQEWGPATTRPPSPTPPPPAPPPAPSPPPSPRAPRTPSPSRLRCAAPWPCPPAA